MIKLSVKFEVYLHPLRIYERQHKIWKISPVRDLRSTLYNWRFCQVAWHMTLTLNWVILHNVVHHSSTSTYMPNFTEIEVTFCGMTDGHLRPTLLGRLRRVDLKTGWFGVNRLLLAIVPFDKPHMSSS